MFDKNGDGYISVEELGEAMKQAGQELSVDEVRDMVKAVDRNGESQRPACKHHFTFGNLIKWVKIYKTGTRASQLLRAQEIEKINLKEQSTKTNPTEQELGRLRGLAAFYLGHSVLHMPLE